MPTKGLYLLCTWWITLLLNQANSSNPVSGCDYNPTEQAGTILTPNYPNTYPNNVHCSWKISVATGQIISLKMKTFNLDFSDYVVFHDGPSAQSPIIGITRYTGFWDNTKLTDTIIRSTGPEMFIYFYSDYSVAASGFGASYWAHECKKFTYGIPECSTSCNCIQENTLYCNNFDGTCICKHGWTSYDCSTDVNECSNPHTCEDEYTECRNLNGSYTCDCRPGLKNINGKCADSCSPQNRQCSHLCGATENPHKEHCYCPIGMELSSKDNMSCVECGRVLTNSSGIIDTYTYDRYHYITTRVTTPICTWTILATRGYVIELKFQSFIMYNGYQRKFGYLEIYDGGDSKGTLLAVYDGMMYRVCPPFMYDTNCSVPCNCNQSNTEYCNSTNVSLKALGKLIDGFKVLFYTSFLSLLVAAGLEESPRIAWGTSYTIVALEDAPVCQQGKFGPDCNQSCSCVVNNTASCDPRTGQCKCKSGWTFPDCSEDIDECQQDLYTCPYYSSCTNTPGDYNCTCDRNHGYENNGICRNFMFGESCANSCNCSKNNTEYCDNLYGNCICKPGWKGETCKEDVDECLGTNNHLCPPKSTCENNQGSYNCTCVKGYRKNQTTEECEGRKYLQKDF
ncbi:multiple epidermal growth factor-like domains protein 10 [Physella acuta]|uniref:multiple epidermal growth factor-like domains protein 10 n=1 Tax=Physella acuta TaxID=109671 RepID=UPI0027DE4BA1|nr:multiple epidermal growth factor-like domains protein 10 [Physella acuta]